MWNRSDTTLVAMSGIPGSQPHTTSNGRPWRGNCFPSLPSSVASSPVVSTDGLPETKCPTQGPCRLSPLTLGPNGSMRIDSVRTDGHVMENLADRIHRIHTPKNLYSIVLCSESIDEHTLGCCSAIGFEVSCRPVVEVWYRCHGLDMCPQLEKSAVAWYPYPW